MLLNPSQYSPQGLMPQFAGLQAAGTPPMGPAFFGQPGPYANGHSPYSVGAQPYPFAGPANPSLQSTQNPFLQTPFALNPYLAGQVNPYLQANQFAYASPFGSAGLVGATNPAQQIVQILAQLAQQIFAQSALSQQIGAAIQQLAQATVHSLQAQQTLGTGQVFGLGSQAYGQSPYGQSPYGQSPYGLSPFGMGPFGPSPFGPSPFTTPGQAGYAGVGTQAGFGPQAQAWGLNRPPTIQ